jgi:hypothetical protein
MGALQGLVGGGIPTRNPFMQAMGGMGAMGGMLGGGGGGMSPIIQMLMGGGRSSGMPQQGLFGGNGLAQMFEQMARDRMGTNQMGGVGQPPPEWLQAQAAAGFNPQGQQPYQPPQGGLASNFFGQKPMQQPFQPPQTLGGMLGRMKPFQPPPVQQAPSQPVKWDSGGALSQPFTPPTPVMAGPNPSNPWEGAAW